MRILALLAGAAILIGCSTSDPAPDREPAPRATAPAAVLDFTVVGKQYVRVGNAVVVRFTVLISGRERIIDALAQIIPACFGVKVGHVLPVECR